MRYLLTLAAAALVLVPWCAATPVPVHFVSALVEVTGPEPLPIELGGFFSTANNLRLRFHVPDAANIVAVNSLSVFVDLYDDGDANDNEEGDLVFVFQVHPLSNLILQSFGPGLNGFTPASPLTVTGTLDPGDLALAEIQDDAHFLIRVNRNGGDFFVQSATATLDAQLIPEPATAALAGGALGLCALARIVRSRRLARRQPHP